MSLLNLRLFYTNKGNVNELTSSSVNSRARSTLVTAEKIQKTAGIYTRKGRELKESLHMCRCTKYTLIPNCMTISKAGGLNRERGRKIDTHTRTQRSKQRPRLLRSVSNGSWLWTW